MAAPELNAVLLQRMDLTKELAILRVAPTGWDLPEFKPGQFGVLGLAPAAPRCASSEPEDDETIKKNKDFIRRAYSIASSSVAHEFMEFYIVLVTTGALTPRLFALDIGDKLWLSPRVSGMFTLDDVPEGKNVILVSTGTGLAPYISMLRSHLYTHDSRRYAVIHGARSSWDLGYRTELINLDRMCPNFTYIPIISRPQLEMIPWSGQVGHVQRIWEDGVIEKIWDTKFKPEDTHIFLCGNPAMIDGMVSLLESQGYTVHSKKTPGTIHFEKYW